jgi:hypothetical protein
MRRRPFGPYSNFQSAARSHHTTINKPEESPEPTELLGEGYRNSQHVSQEVEFGCTEYAKCGSDATERSVETKSCATCDVATCDECRIHCVYQTIYQAPSDLNDPSELPCFSGFVMLHPHEQPILSPHHLPTDGTHDISRWEDPSKSSSGPYHDQGYLDVPLELSVTAPPEAIEDILDLDLGQRALPLVSEDSRHGHGFPSPVLNSICRVVDARKIELCEWCFKDKAPYGPAATIPFGDFVTSLPWLTRTTAFSPIEPCHCTLRTRFLDRWLCLRCYENEENVIGECTVDSPMKNARMCQCGWISSHTLCLWCWGEVTEETGEVEDEASDHTTSSEMRTRTTLEIRKTTMKTRITREIRKTRMRT